MTFPSDRYDDLDVVQQSIPSFWTETYGGRAMVDDLLRSMNVQQRQMHQLAQELFDSMGRVTCPVYHRDIWLPVVLREDQGEAASLIQFGDDLVYGPQVAEDVTYVFGGAFDDSWRFPLSADVVSASLLTDDIVSPSVVMTAGSEFKIVSREGYLIFSRDPFNDARFTPYTEADGIRRIRVYLFNANRDWAYLSTLYGNVAGILLDSSENYKKFLNAVLDGISTGTSMGQIYSAVEAMTGIPFAEEGEIVEVVTEDASGKLVITDRNVYRIPSAATVIVGEGDVLTKKQRIVDAVTIDEVGSEIPTGLTEFTLGESYLPSGLGDLTFEDADKDLVVTTGVSGFTKVEFELGGETADVTAFFTEMHDRGVAANATLANYLDIREAPTTEPTALNLPATINPLKFLFENVLRGTICLVRVKTDEISSDGIGIDRASVLRTIMPPHASLVILEE